ncbi:chitin synthase-domain-containing protein [Fimicolochytrium jonesii]|uniref:chitin synthase-domain-containing protein n=1 Tax=Fimicolochytrium jonesii TaxID=1396493 RepID=UPI0022FDC993|nr:chitin synthase-domain-containing protein [Fimicolochytrium jonesii]KAI8820835.1 chitin synthase-domain-containing protein [Fimicolochytrium jonesii]
MHDIHSSIPAAPPPSMSAATGASIAATHRSPDRPRSSAAAHRQSPRYTQSAYPQPQTLGSDLSNGTAVLSSSPAAAAATRGQATDPHVSIAPTYQIYDVGYDGSRNAMSSATLAYPDGPGGYAPQHHVQQQPYTSAPDHPNFPRYGSTASPSRSMKDPLQYQPQTQQQQQQNPYVQDPYVSPLNPYFAPTPSPHTFNFAYPLAYTPSQPSYLSPPTNPRGGRPGTLFRHKTMKTIELTPNGLFQVEIPVPAKVVQQGTERGRECTHLRYTAVVGDPDEFVSRGYTLRAQEMGRRTEIFVVLTMYNEDETLFCKTWKAVMKNIVHLCSKNTDTWGPLGWQKVVVCVVADGRTKINPRTLNVLGVMGVFQQGVLKTSINNTDVAVHLFEYTTQICIDAGDGHSLRSSKTASSTSLFRSGGTVIPVQTIFCLKEKNAKKINSHRWFFNAFAKQLNPHICVLLDVGTKPTDPSLYRLWKAFDSDEHCAGACGEIAAETGSWGWKLWNPLVAAQNFEYKMSCILDKPMESVFGFIAVLPGAFSAYRYQALQNGADGTGPLQKYFLGERMHGGSGGVHVSEANMYLAEDRILCFELVTKRNSRYTLRYVSAAKAETDVPDTLPEFISQRRRWLNGSFFAGIHAITHFYQLFRSSHTPERTLLILALLIYNAVNVIFNWFSLATFYLIFYFLADGMTTDPARDPFYGAGKVIFWTVRQLYVFAIATVFIASLGNRPQGSLWLYVAVFGLFAGIMVLMLYMSAFSIKVAISSALTTIHTTSADGTVHTSLHSLPSLLANPSFRDLVMSTAATYGAYVIASVAYLDPWHMLNSFVQYLLFLPGFMLVLTVYAFGNLHDISWGTKGDNSAPDVAPVHCTKDSTKGITTATVDLPVHQHDIDASYDSFLAALAPPPKTHAKTDTRSAALRQEDYFRLYRTRVVLFWVLCNVGLVAALTTASVAEKLGVFVGDAGKGRTNRFLTFMLWSVCALSGWRFVGSMVFLATRGGGEREGKEAGEKHGHDAGGGHGAHDGHGASGGHSAIDANGAHGYAAAGLGV